MIRRRYVGFVLSINALLVGWIVWCTSPNTTEVGHMAATVYFWHTFRFDVFRVNPPLTRMVAGLPVVMCRPNYDWSDYSSRPQARPEWLLGSKFIAANSPGRIRWCFTLARWSLIPLLLLGGYFGHRLSREIYGESSACLFLALWCFSPLLLGWGATIAPDAVAAALGIVAVYTFHQWLHKPNWTKAVIAGICLGLLPLTKLTWIIAFGIWPLIWCFWTVPIYLTKADRRFLPLPPIRQLAAILFLSLYVLNMGYLFDGTCRPLGQYVFASQLLRGPEATDNQRMPAVENRFSGKWLGAVPVPFPAEFVRGMDTQRYDFERGLRSYFRGEWADHGWWYYYLYALLVKEPLGTWALVALAIGVIIFNWRRKKPSPPAPLPKGEGRLVTASWRDEMVVLVPGLAILIIVSSQTGFSVHSRYILPALPFLFVWTSKVARALETREGLTLRRQVAKVGWYFAPWRLCVSYVDWLRCRKQPVMAVLVILALAWSVGSSLAVYPHSLSYFNELAAVLPTPADASYPTPMGRNNENRGVLSTIIGAGPRNGPRHLLDSNIDWGQDLFYLEDWYESHPEARPIKVAYFGGYPLDRSKVKSAGLPPTGLDREQIDDKTDTTTFGPLPGWYALSVNEIYGRSQQYRYFLHFQPVAMAGYSIYIYHITLDDANRVRRDLGMPELPKDWQPREDTDHAGDTRNIPVQLTAQH